MRTAASRRQLLGGVLASSSLLPLLDPRSAFAESAAPTPQCHDNHGTTVRQTEGPYFKPSSPQRADLVEPDTTGRLVEIDGQVTTRSCRPVERALVDLWHADEHGEYDNPEELIGLAFEIKSTDYRGEHSIFAPIASRYPELLTRLIIERLLRSQALPAFAARYVGVAAAEHQERLRAIALGGVTPDRWAKEVAARALNLESAQTLIRELFVILEGGCHLRVLSREYLLATYYQAHPRAERAEHVYEFHAGDSRADHDKVLGHGRRRVGIPGRQDSVAVRICP